MVGYEDIEKDVGIESRQHHLPRISSMNLSIMPTAGLCRAGGDASRNYWVFRRGGSA
jgi:hypothetical protein